MNILFAISASLAFFHLVSAQPLQPPMIVEQPPEKKFYRMGTTFSLPCSATGNPAPNYEWKKNGHIVSGAGVVTPGGSLQFTEPAARDNIDGLYQCWASNNHGTALSRTSLVQGLRDAVFPAQSVPVEKQAAVGSSLILDCQPDELSIPKPSALYRIKDYSWQPEKHPGQPQQPDWVLNRRSQIDDNGNLNVAFVKESDFSSLIWECYIHNKQLSSYNGGSKTRIVNSGEAPVGETKPQIMFYSNKTGNPGNRETLVVGLENRTVSLRCFFSGSEHIGISWRRIDGGHIPTESRIDQLNYNIELAIGFLKTSDAGRYACTGSNTVGSTDFPLELRVDAVPEFKRMEDKPHDFNTNVGDTVHFRCNAYARPNATVTWFRNGVPIDMNNPPPKFVFSDVGKMLSIGPVCKNNCGGPNDLMVIQCQASNQHGTAFGNGFINVYERTVLTSRPKNVIPDFGKPVSFGVHAKSDPDTPITYTWYRSRDGKTCMSEWCELFNVTDKYIISNENGSSLTILNTEEKDIGLYKCVASNTVSSDEHVVTLEEPKIAAASLPDWWWIPFVIIIVVLIILIIILLICCYIYRNRGDEYPVDEKERKADRNPDQELADSGFHDFQRPTSHRYEEDRQPLTTTYAEA